MTVPKWLDDETVYYSTTQKPAGRMMIPDAPLANRAVSARRLQAHQDTPPPVPQPKAIDCVVVVDYPSRTLYARLPDSSTGLGRSHWTQAWQQLKLDEERGSRAPDLWASTPTSDRVARVTAGEGQQLKVFFEPGNAVYSQLISKPLVGIATVDLAQKWFLRLSFLHRP
jgi:hypothetical protein